MIKQCAITRRECYRWDDENTTLFCDTCPTSYAHKFALEHYPNYRAISGE